MASLCFPGQPPSVACDPSGQIPLLLFVCSGSPLPLLHMGHWDARGWQGLPTPGASLLVFSFYLLTQALVS